MKPTPIEEARRALALASNAVIDACKSETNDPDISGVNLLTSVHRLLRTVQNNVHLDRARADSMAEYRRDNAPILAKKVRAIRDLRALRDDAQATFPVLDESRRVTATSSDDTLAKFDAMVRDVLKKGGDIDEGDVSDPNAGSGDVLDTLWTILTEWLLTKGIDSQDPSLMSLVKRFEPIRETLTWCRHSGHLLEQVHPAPKWWALEQLAADSNPSPHTVGWRLLKHLPRYSSPYRFLHEPRALQPEDGFRLNRLRQEVSANVASVRVDFEARLGMRASVGWLLQRYARRCRWLRLAELQSALNRIGTAQKERFLTRDAAVFLFDEGFDVLIEQPLGQHRYDVIGPTLVVESKVFDHKRRPLDAVVKGLQQIHQYATALGNEGPTLEPILVVFRLGGPVADLPHEHTIGSLRVSIVQVDLGSAAESGSHAKTPDTTVTTEAIDRRRARKASKEKRA